MIGWDADFTSFYGSVNMVNLIGVKLEKSKTYSEATQETMPYLPNYNCNFMAGTSLANGLVMVDENENEWVWVEVPKSVTASATTDDSIYDALVNYVQGTANTTDTATIIPRNSYCVDTWGNEDESITLSEVMSKTKYDTNKTKMLQSIKESGGFWVGRYEVGIANDLYRTEATDENKSTTALSNFSAVIQQNAKPYTYVTESEAEELAEGLNPAGDKTSSLMYGIQWDLILRFMYEKSNKTSSDLNAITTDCTSWGNYPASTINLNRGQYTGADGTNKITNNWQNVTVGSKSNDTIMLLTAGASDDTKRMNIYDISGNCSEWILERFTVIKGETLVSGPFKLGDYSEGYTNGANGRFHTSGTGYSSEVFVGFRPVLY